MQKHDEQQKMQRDYYARTALEYDSMHYGKLDEHQFALAWMHGLIDLFDIKSILDIGSGTGRAIVDLKARFPDKRIVGLEPSADLREIGYKKGLAEDELIDGDARSLSFADGEFDLVCEFATLHHVPRPELVVSEMLRVAKVGIFISDSNKLGQGGRVMRMAKGMIDAVGLWSLLDLVRTRGKGYMTSDSDGLFYSYSVFDNYAQINKECYSVHIMNTTGSVINPRSSASHVALLGLKQEILTRS